MPVISALDEKTGMDKGIELPSVGVADTHMAGSALAVRMASLSMCLQQCSMVGESLAKKNYRHSTYCKTVLQLAKTLGNYRKDRLSVLRVHKECLQMYVQVDM